ncbi:hypothetical protein ASE71_08020 [Ensifer sp. Root954]|nr:hypothetical protein ASE71_08020 [Ensifer sp. Root954]
MLEIFDSIENQHRQVNFPTRHSNFQDLIDVLARPIDANRSRPLSLRSRRKAAGDSLWTVAVAFMNGFMQFRRLMSQDVQAVYLHTSHLQLDEPNCFSWLSRSTVVPFFFVHDLIPIEFPEYCSAGATERHERRIETVLRHAKGILVNSEFTRASLENYTRDRHLPATAVVPLANTISHGVIKLKTKSVGNPAFFLHVGTIEGRKNIGHLLNVWRRLIQVLGPESTPRLILIGRRGWECENVLSVIDRSRELANHLIEVSDVNDSELQDLMLRSAGLVTVSVTEGFGLPPVEAARLGLPVIASDIPAHRETLRNAARFVPVHDGEALLNEVISALRRSNDKPLPAQIEAIEWDRHVQSALVFVESELRR